MPSLPPPGRVALGAGACVAGAEVVVAAGVFVASGVVVTVGVWVFDVCGVLGVAVQAGGIWTAAAWIFPIAFWQASSVAVGTGVFVGSGDAPAYTDDRV